MKKKMPCRIEIILALSICTLAFSACKSKVLETRPQHTADLSLEETRDLLDQFQRTVSSSARNPNEAVTPLLRLRDQKPIDKLESLYANRDPSVIELDGTFFGIICRYVSPSHFLNVFAEDLDHPDPKIRMFACSALGELGEKKAIPFLRMRLTDHEVVSGYSDGRVSLTAAFALAWLGSHDGFPLLIEYARNNPHHWEYSVLKHFRRFSNEDFDTDLDSWIEYFSKTPPRPPVGEEYRWSRMVGKGPLIPVYVLQ